MLACTRIGAIHLVVFGGFSPDSLAGRISDCKSDIVITADEGVRGESNSIKENTDEAISISVEFVIVLLLKEQVEILVGLMTEMFGITN